MAEASICRRRIAEADLLRVRNPVAALEEALAAVESASRVEAAYDEWRLLQADAWAVVGSCRRASAQLEEAEDAFAVAARFSAGIRPLDRGSRRRRARLMQRVAYLRRDQGQLSEALTWIDAAADFYRRLSDRHGLAACEVDRGIVLAHWSRRSAIDCFAAVLPQLDPSRDPINFLAAVHNLAFLLQEDANDAASRHEASRWLLLAQECRAQLAFSADYDDLLQIKGRSLSAQKDLRTVRWEQGLIELWEAYEAYRRAGAVWEQLDLLLLLTRYFLVEQRDQDRLACVALRIRNLAVELRGHSVARSVLEALDGALRSRNATPELVSEVAAALQKRRAAGEAIRL